MSGCCIFEGDVKYRKLGMFFRLGELLVVNYRRSESLL